MNLFSDPISSGRIPLELDLNFEKPSDEAYPFRVTQDQFYLCPSINGVAPFVLPLPMGYRTDGPSIPWYAQAFVPKDGPAWVAALFHDLGCSAELFSCPMVNAIMISAMLDSPVPVPRPTFDRVKWAIEMFCERTWASHKAEDVEEDRMLALACSKRLWATHSPLFAGYARIEEVSEAFL